MNSPSESTKIKLMRFALILFGLTSVYSALRESAWLGGTDQILKLAGSKVRWKHTWVPFFSRKDMSETRVFDFDLGKTLSEYRETGYSQQRSVSPLGPIAEIHFDGSQNTRHLVIVDSETGKAIAKREVDDPFLSSPFSFTSDGHYFVCDRNPQSPGDPEGIGLLNAATLQTVDSFEVSVPSSSNSLSCRIAGDYAFFKDTNQLVHFGEGRIRVVPIQGLEPNDRVESISSDALALVQRGIHQLMNEPSRDESDEVQDDATETSKIESQSESLGKPFLINLLSGEVQEIEKSIEHAGHLEFIGVRWLFCSTMEGLDILNRNLTRHVKFPHDSKTHSIFLDSPQPQPWFNGQGTNITKLKTYNIESGVCLDRQNLARAWINRYWLSVLCIGIWSLAWIAFELWTAQRLGLTSAGLLLAVWNGLSYSFVLAFEYTDDLGVRISVGIMMAVSIVLAAFLNYSGSHWLSRIAIWFSLMGIALIGPCSGGTGYRFEIVFALIGVTPVAVMLMRMFRLSLTSQRQPSTKRLTLTTLLELQAAIGLSTVVTLNFFRFYPEPFSLVHCLVLMTIVATLGVSLLGTISKFGRSRIGFAMATISFAIIGLMVLDRLPWRWQNPSAGTMSFNSLHVGGVLTEPQLSLLIMGGLLVILAKGMGTFDAKEI